MQTFLPYSDYTKSAQCLDMRRLGKQRVEALQLANSQWPNHPASKMWRGHRVELIYYGIAICKEWIKRGYKDTCLEQFRDLLLYPLKLTYYNEFTKPPWLNDDAFHLAHQSNLVRKNPEYYRKFFPDVPDDLPYIWPEG